MNFNPDDGRRNKAWRIRLRIEDLLAEFDHAEETDAGLDLAVHRKALQTGLEAVNKYLRLLGVEV
jgi:hypothetical protein